MLKLLSFIVVLFLFSPSNGQELSTFSGLHSKGSIPQEFLVSSTEKYKIDYSANKNEKLGKDFFRSTRFFIDQMLLSGKVLFNESLSNYLNDVAQYTFKTNPKLLSELQFYVLKSTQVNAFSTDQGIIFFTTGLLAQLENEAQLAYILCHEVSHYTEKHVQDSYVERIEMRRGKSKYSRMGYEDRINAMSVYDKENELDADSKGVDMYLQTEYRVDDIVSSFGVLLYSYLPFEDTRFDTLYLNTDILKIPSSLFSDSVTAITKEENYDDFRSTHPNIKTRIDNSVDIINDRLSEGNKQFVVSESRFFEVRELARFEGVRIKLAERDYINALYDIYLLQQYHDDNQYLDFAFMQAFYGLSKYKNAGRFSEIRTRLSKIEGESYRLHAFIQKLSKGQLNVMAYRYAYDLMKKYPENVLYKRYEKDLKADLALSNSISIKKLKANSFDILIDSVEVLKEEINIEDSIRKIEASDLSKYQKIKLKKKLSSLNSETINDTDSPQANFHYYALWDIVQNDSLVESLLTLKNKASDNAASAEEVEFLGQNESIKMGIDSIVIVDPIISQYSNQGNEAFEKSEKFQQKLNELYMDDYPRLNLNRELVSSKQLTSVETKKYNELGEMYLYLGETIEHDDINMISSCHNKVLEMAKSYGTNSFLFSRIDLSKDRKAFTSSHLVGFVFIVTIPLVLYDLRVRNYIDYRVMLLDVSTDELLYGDNVSLKVKGTTNNIDFMVYHVLRNISAKNK